MKKSALAFAVFGAIGGTASAQSSVTVYGIVDTGVVVEKGGSAGTVTKLTSGVASSSRLGFKGTEDLGGGLSAGFVIENGFNADTGAQTGSLLFGRQAYVGLKGDFGAVNVGRQYTPFYQVAVAADPFGNGMAGKFGNLMATSGVRMDNAIKYSSPVFGGFSSEVAYGFGEVASDSAASRALSLAVNYANGPLKVGVGQHKLNNATATDSARNTVIAGTYDFGMVKAHLSYGINKGSGTVDTRDLLAGVTIPFGAHKFLASYITKDDHATDDRNASQWALGYVYAMSKRTDFYASIARITNENGATYTVGNSTEAGSGNQAMNAGIRHSF